MIFPRTWKRYDNKSLSLYLLAVIGILLLSYRTSGAIVIGLVPILFLAGALHPRRLFVALIMSITLILSNSFFVPKTTGIIVTFRMLTLFVGAVGLLFIWTPRGNALLAPFLAYYAYVAYMFIPSFSGWNAGISLMKLVHFSLTFSCYYIISSRVARLGPSDESSVRSVLLACAIIYILGSIILIPFPGISLMNPFDLDVHDIIARGVTLYKGMAMHSQALGPMVAMLTVFVFGDWLFCVRQSSWLHLLIVPAGLYVIYKTGSRTALGSALAGLVMCYFVMKFKQQGLSGMWKTKTTRLLTLVVIAGVSAVLSVPSLRQGAAKFILKFDPSAQAEDVSFNEITKTRKGKYESTLANFKNSPVIGNGFQVSEEFAGVDIPLTKLVSAPVEKGFFVTALLEEGGSVGFLVFWIVTLCVLRTLYVRNGYLSVVTFSTMLVANCGEFTMFSMTSTGGFNWAIVFSAAVLDEFRTRGECSFPGFVR